MKIPKTGIACLTPSPSLLLKYLYRHKHDARTLLKGELSKLQHNVGLQSDRYKVQSDQTNVLLASLVQSVKAESDETDSQISWSHSFNCTNVKGYVCVQFHCSCQ